MPAPAATILIVDDEPRNRTLLEALLQPEGYLTRSAADGAAALASIAEQAPDLILLDVTMPDMNGNEVAARLKASPATASIPIVMVSAQVERGARLAALDAGAEEYLTKPVDRAELYLRVRNLLRLKTLGDFLQNHSLILEREVQARTASLAESELRFRRFVSAMDATVDAIYLVDRATMRYVYVNDAACRMLESTREELLALGPAALIGVAAQELEARYDAMIASGLPAEPLELPRTRKSGKQVWVELRRHALRSGEGWTIVTLVRDITEQRLAQAKIVRLNRVYAVLSGINAGIVRIRERGRLFDEVCRIAVSEGGFVLARVLELDAGGKARIAATSEPDSRAYQEIIDEYNRDPQASASLVALALRSGELMISNDVRNDPRIPERAALTAGGNYALALLPMLVEKRVAGALVLRAVGTGAFDEDELRLLLALVGNLSFALENIGKAEKLGRMTRVNAMLSGINGATVRVRHRQELFDEACRIAVEAGAFRLAWIGVVDRQAGTIMPAAVSGAGQDYLEHMPLAIADADPGRGLPGKAVQDNRPVIANDIATDERVLLRAEALEHGLRSLALLPLAISGEVIGLMALYADTPGFFDEEEMRLLAELAGNIAFAIDHIGKQDRLEYLAYYDELTELANRSLFLERLAQHMLAAAAAGHALAVFLIDLERFKNFNDSLGQKAGDGLLKQVAQWLAHRAGDASLVARVEADHFAVVVPVVRREDNMAGLIEREIAAFLAHPFQLEDDVFRMALKMGVAQFPEDGSDADALLKNAETALKKAKARGDPYLFYKPRMTEGVAGELTLENQLREALDRNEFVLHYQPKVGLASGRLTSAEALIRWNDPRTGLVPPARFIPVLEETGLIGEVGRWALRKAVADYLGWRAAGLAAVPIAVNVSPLQLRHRGFVEEIERVIAVDPEAAGGLELEITESVIMDDAKHNIATLQAIRAMGVRIAIDDFGTGFSSLSYLSKLPVDTLKIDRSFVVEMTLSSQGLALVSAIITLAHSLKLKVVAEGVETEEQSRLLRLLKCDEMQGYLFSKPTPGADFAARFLKPTASTPSAALPIPSA